MLSAVNDCLYAYTYFTSTRTSRQCTHSLIQTLFLTHTDYSSIPSMVTILAGTNHACFEGSITDDTITEKIESFTIVINCTSPSVTVRGGTTTINILDNDEGEE